MNTRDNLYPCPTHSGNLPTAPLYNTPLFTQHLESAYLSLYDRYQKGLAPEHIYVEP